MEIGSVLERYVVLLQEGAYFDAHELLEEIWRALPHGERRDLIRGYINAAIAFEHLRRDRPEALARAQRTLGAYERYKDYDHTGLFTHARRCVEQIKRGYCL